ncbi:MucR family transcriptional regulator [Mesorhizobium sp. Root552]|uniref:MucR family transcriptional regulator n=1 Tax=Mesorhizobium sp. Root552 TaxID=1736555 RepID=UPI0006F9D2AF|nr:MucR family transcriptional regulator [Mesorhizobium sp. Root552]KQZ28623.1 MucR family transcriptional regulator [Mesorhizobium sp. Root552]
MTEKQTVKLDRIELTVDIVSAYIAKHAVPSAELAALIQQVHQTLSSLDSDGSAVEPEAEKQRPAVPIKKSVTPDYIISLEDGRPFKSLKRHLATQGMTPADYRAKWNLPADYPMVALNYAAQRSALAKKLGLGRKPAPPAKPVRKKAAPRKSTGT